VVKIANFAKPENVTGNVELPTSFPQPLEKLAQVLVDQFAVYSIYSTAYSATFYSGFNSMYYSTI
jgi:hypothetical protein